MDIKNIGKDSYSIKKMKSKMRNISIEEIEIQQLKDLNKLKVKIHKRILELTT